MTDKKEISDISIEQVIEQVGENNTRKDITAEDILTVLEPDISILGDAKHTLGIIKNIKKTGVYTDEQEGRLDAIKERLEATKD